MLSFAMISGEGATRAVISDARSLAESLPPGRNRDELLQHSDEAEAYVNQLADLCHKGMVRWLHSHAGIWLYD